MTKDEFYRQWLTAFASNIPESEIAKYVKSTGNFIWHVFSWELLDKGVYLSAEAAKAAYDNVDKSDAICIDWFQDKQTTALTCNLYTAEALDRITEIYVVSKDFKWTYIKTHESQCGPYFMKR